MARDYAKQRKTPAKGKKAPVRRKPASKNTNRGGGLRLYFAGLISGLFISFVAYMYTLPGENEPPRPVVAETEAEEAAPQPRFEFYTMLPTDTFKVESSTPPPVEPAPDVGEPVRETYLLQAGSFRMREDADRRRAELLLLGLEPTIQESETDNGRWHRVYLGPYGTRGEASRARSLTAGQGIDTLLLKRGG